MPEESMMTMTQEFQELVNAGISKSSSLEVNYQQTDLVYNWRQRAAFQRSAFGRSTAGNDVVATIFIRLFFFFFLFSRFFFLRRDLFS